MKIKAIALAFISLVVFAAPKDSTSPTGSTIEIQDLGLFLPGLPLNVATANAAPNAFHTRLEAQLKSLNVSLMEVYQATTLTDGQKISIPKIESRKSEILFLKNLINDDCYLQLESSVKNKWNTWQQMLLDQGVVDFNYHNNHSIPMGKGKIVKDPSPIHMGDPKSNNAMDSTIEEKKITSDLKNSYTNPDVELRDYSNSYNARNPGSSNLSIQRLNLCLINTAFFERVAKTKVGRKYADKNAPDLATLWEPLAQHLMACNAQLLEYEQAAPKEELPGMAALRGYAKLAFLERYRSALWFDAMVWAYMASRTPPVNPLEYRKAEMAQAPVNGK